jgi:hypothetical protein
MVYPNSCIRGIPNPTCLTEENKMANKTLYQFNNKGPEGWFEESINWNDDAMSVHFTLKQKKNDGELRYKIGVAILQRNEIDLIIRKRGISDRFKYERKPTPEPPNRYHGNLLMNSDISPSLKDLIRSQLAWISEIHFRHEYSDLQPASCFSKLASLFKAIAANVFREKPL